MTKHLAKENWNCIQIGGEMEAIEGLCPGILDVYYYDKDGGLPIEHPKWDWFMAKVYPEYVELRQRDDKLAEERGYA